MADRWSMCLEDPPQGGRQGTLLMFNQDAAGDVGLLGCGEGEADRRPKPHGGLHRTIKSVICKAVTLDTATKKGVTCFNTTAGTRSLILGKCAIPRLLGEKGHASRARPTLPYV